MEQFTNLKMLADNALPSESGTIVDTDTLKSAVYMYKRINMVAIAMAEKSFPRIMEHLSTLASEGARKAEIDLHTDREGVEAVRDQSTGKIKGVPVIYASAMSSDDMYTRLRMASTLSWLFRKTRGITKVSTYMVVNSMSIMLEW